MRLIVSAGATGGGINPALAVLQALGEKPESVLWIGSVGGMEADLVNRAGIPYRAIPAGGVHGVSGEGTVEFRLSETAGLCRPDPVVALWKRDGAQGALAD